MLKPILTLFQPVCNIPAYYLILWGGFYCVQYFKSPPSDERTESLSPGHRVWVLGRRWRCGSPVRGQGRVYHAPVILRVQIQATQLHV